MIRTFGSQRSVGSISYSYAGKFGGIGHLDKGRASGNGMFNNEDYSMTREINTLNDVSDHGYAFGGAELFKDV